MSARAMLLVFLVAIPSAGADFLQVGGDAARTGTVEGTGPLLDEVAFEVRLPGSAAHGQPLWTPHGLLVLVADLEQAPHLNTTGVFRIELDRGTATPFMTMEDHPTFTLVLPDRTTADVIIPPTWASDGDRLFVTTPSTINAYDLRSREIIWQWERPQLMPQDDGMKCVEPAIRDGTLIVACSVFGRQAATAGAPSPQTQTRVFVVRMDTETGGRLEERIWVRPVTTETSAECSTDVVQIDALTCSNPFLGVANGLSWVDDTVIVPHILAPGRSGAFNADGADINNRCNTFRGTVTGEYWGLESNRLTTAWTKSTYSEAPTGEVPNRWIDMSSHPTGADNLAYVKMGGELVMFESGNGGGEQRRDMSGEDSSSFLTGTGFGLLDQYLFAATSQSLYRIDLSDREFDPPRPFFHYPQAAHTYISTSPLLHSEEALFVRSSQILPACDPRAPAEDYLMAIDLDSLEVLWRQTLAIEGRSPYTLGSYFSIDGEHGAWIAANGTLRILGRTAVSIQPLATISDKAPEAGQRVVIDARASGGLEPATRFRVDWGDGFVTPWQNESRFEHAYAADGAYAAQVHVANGAGQRSVFVHTFQVGQNPAVAWWPYLLALSIGVVITSTSVYGAKRVRRPRAIRAYRTAIQREIGESGPPLRERLRPLRDALGISESQHGRLEAEVRQAMGQGAAGSRLIPGELFLDRYHVVRRLGRGGQGAAFLCHDQKADRDVVIKVTHGGAAAKGIMEEAKRYARVRSPHLVRLLDVDAIGRDVFMVLEYVEGDGLAAALGSGPMDPAAARDLADALFGGLEALHAAGLVHADVSPANVFGDPEGGFVLGDLGLARDAAVTMVGSAGGTPLYMAPEVLAGSRPTVASDIYSAGRVMVHAITGAVDGTPRRALKAWVDKATHADAEGRFASAKQARAALVKALG